MDGSREMPKLTKKIVKRVKALRPEAQVRLNYYLQWFHDSAHHQAQMHIWSTADPATEPALLSLRVKGPVKSSPAVSLGDLAVELGLHDERVEDNQLKEASPLIVFTSEGEEDGDKGKEEGDREVSPQLQHASETATASEPVTYSEGLASQEEEIPSADTTLSEGRSESRKKFSKESERC